MQKCGLWIFAQTVFHSLLNGFVVALVVLVLPQIAILLYKNQIYMPHYSQIISFYSAFDLGYPRWPPILHRPTRGACRFNPLIIMGCSILKSFFYNFKH